MLSVMVQTCSNQVLGSAAPRGATGMLTKAQSNKSRFGGAEPGAIDL